MQLYNRFTSIEFYKNWIEHLIVQEWDGYEDYMEKYGPNNDLDAYSKANSMGAFFDGIGVLVRRNLIDHKLVFDLYSPAVIMTTWNKYEEFLKTVRRFSNDPAEYSAFDYLYNEAVKMNPKANTIQNPLKN